MKKYKVTWDTKESGRIFPHERIIEAESAKEARNAFDEWWSVHESARWKVRHAFHILVKVAKEAES